MGHLSVLFLIQFSGLNQDKKSSITIPGKHYTVPIVIAIFSSIIDTKGEEVLSFGY